MKRSRGYIKTRQFFKQTETAVGKIKLTLGVQLTALKQKHTSTVFVPGIQVFFPFKWLNTGSALYLIQLSPQTTSVIYLLRLHLLLVSDSPKIQQCYSVKDLSCKMHLKAVLKLKLNIVLYYRRKILCCQLSQKSGKKNIMGNLHVYCVSLATPKVLSLPLKMPIIPLWHCSTKCSEN